MHTQKALDLSRAFNHLNPARLDAEGRAAAASATYVGILELEAGAFQGFYIVDGHALKVHQ